MEIKLEFTTTPDFKRLLSVNLSREKLIKTLQDTGTLMDPKSEIVATRIHKKLASCSIR